MFTKSSIFNQTIASSYTGEDTIEFQLHGSLVIKSMMLQTLAKFPDFRIADAGEFTKRAVFNNKLDLLEAQGVNDLINAECKSIFKIT